jgi:hypothetical protein
MRRERPVVRVGGSSCVYTVSVGKPDRKSTLARPKRRWKDIIIIWIWIMWIFKEKKERAKTGFTWLRRGTSDEFLWTRHWTFWFHKTRGIWLAEAVLASGSDPRSRKTSLHSARNSPSLTDTHVHFTLHAQIRVQSHFRTVHAFASSYSSVTYHTYLLQYSTCLRQLLQLRHFSLVPPDGRAFASFYSCVTSHIYLLPLSSFKFLSHH